MKTYYPSFYEKFSCLCSGCPDTCCAKWEIVVDENSVGEYKKISGKFGKKIRNNIVKDADGDYIFKLNKGRCPFLNDKNLCEIHINLGAEKTCEVCRQHPDFIEIYDDFTEVCPSLSCPETVCLLFGDLSQNAVYPDVLSESDDFVLQLLLKGRKQALEISKEKASFENKCKKMCLLANELQKEIDGFAGGCKYNFDFSDALVLLREKIDILTDEWSYLLYNLSSEKIKTVDGRKIEILLSYFIYRYFLKAVNDCDVLTSTRFILFSVWFCFETAKHSNINFTEVARLFSKEIEHNTDNIDVIRNYLIQNE